MCLYDNELFLLGVIPLMQIARLLLFLSLPEGRAGLHVDCRAIAKRLLRILLFTIPAVATIKLFHDWFGYGHRTYCMSRIMFFLGTTLLCAALELGGAAPQPAETDYVLDIETRHPWRICGLRFLLGAVWLALFSRIPFK